MKVRFSPLLLSAFTLLLAIVSAEHLQAQVIAWDDFEGYTAGATVDGENQGYNWTGAWDASTSPANVTVQSGVIPGLGQSLRLDEVTSNNSNVFVRGFGSQTGTTYAAFLLRTSTTETDDFVLFYTNNSTAASDTVGVSGGLRNAGVSGDNFYFARVDGTSNNQNTAFTHPDDTTQLVIFKYSNTAAHGANYDQTDLFVNQYSEGTPDASVAGINSGTSALANFHARLFSFEADDTVFIDNLAFANSFDQLFPQLTTTPSDTNTLDFGNQRVGVTSADQDITAENTGSFTLTSLNFGAASGDFARVGGAGGNDLDTTQTDSRGYNVTASARGSLGGSVNVTGDRGTAIDSALSSNVLLAATGVGPVFGVDLAGGNDATALSAPGGDLSGAIPTTTNAGSLDLGITSGDVLTATITIGNMTLDGDLGDALTGLTINSLVFDDARFSIVGDPTPVTLDGGLDGDSILDLVVQFTPDATFGTATGTLSIFTDQGVALGDDNGAPFTIAFSATTIPEPASLALCLLIGLAIGGIGFLYRRA